VSRPPHTASRDCRTAHPLPVRSRVCLHRNAGTKTTRISVSDPTRSAASRDGMAGWAGEGGGRFGERREYEAPTLPSTPRQHGMARHHKRQPNTGSTSQLATTRVSPTQAVHRSSPPRASAQQRQHIAARHHPSQPENGNATPHPITCTASKKRSKKSELLTHFPFGLQSFLMPENHQNSLKNTVNAPPARCNSVLTTKFSRKIPVLMGLIWPEYQY